MKIPIISYGVTKFKEHWDLELIDLIVKAADAAVEKINIKGNEIDAVYLANNFNVLNSSGGISTLVAERLGIKKVNLIGGTDFAGASVIQQAAKSIMSGENDVVLVVGAEKMSDFIAKDLLDIDALFLDEQEGIQGITPVALFAMITKAHMRKYGTKKEHLALISAQNHKNAKLNPKAQYPFEVSKEQVMNSPVVAEPITVLECSSNPDGAAALIMVKPELAEKYTKKPVYLIGSGQAQDTLALSSKKSLTEMESTINAAKIAYEKAGITSKEVDIAEVHDVFTISELIALEDLGFIEKGSFNGFDNLIPINTSGGLKGCGHPLAATGVRQACEIVMQLSEEAGDRQVKDAKIGLTQTIGGVGSSAVVNIFRVE
ncbi:thiolase domain-containing protein [Candidatus Woesearchaeota archaeon]|nr:thiolase domain-containing protein [Candidatus Woesearchaeota archaeon]